MQFLENEDEFGPKVSLRRNGSMACGVPLLLIDNLSRKSFSYKKLPQEPLKLTIVKLDGSSFGKSICFDLCKFKRKSLYSISTLICLCNYAGTYLSDIKL